MHKYGKRITRGNPGSPPTRSPLRWNKKPALADDQDQNESRQITGPETASSSQQHSQQNTTHDAGANQANGPPPYTHNSYQQQVTQNNTFNTDPDTVVAVSQAVAESVSEGIATTTNQMHQLHQTVSQELNKTYSDVINMKQHIKDIADSHG